jgi:dTDP-4-amino-4,6-dideoxygalactose transaminase
MKIPFIDLRAQYYSIKDEVDHAMSSVIQDFAFVGGKYAKAFEQNFADYIGVRNCIGVGNGTDALYVALKALGISEGDEVITAANTFIATSEAITMTGAKVVFVDCDEATYNIDVEMLERSVNSKTKAIIPVHLYGQPACIDEIEEVAKKHSLYVIEDAAQAHGAEYQGRRTGTIGDIGCFSFYPGKNLGAYGDAGAIVTNREDLAIRCRMIANHGRVDKYDHEFEGVNSRLDGLQAAILSVKLKYLEAWTQKRRAIAAAYRDLLKDTEIILPKEREGVRHVYHLFIVKVKNRKAVQEALRKDGIATGIHYPVALPNLRAYKYLGHKPSDFPVATKYSQEILSLPMYPELTLDQVEYICDRLKIAVES